MKKPMITRSQKKVEILSPLKEISKFKNKKTDEQPDEHSETTDTPDLESKESAAQEEQSAKGLKILTPNKTVSRLTITLAQLKAGNNSEKLKNEIKQLLYSLYSSKKIYQNNL